MPEAQGAAAAQSATASLAVHLRAGHRRDDLLRSLIAAGEIGPGRIARTLNGPALAEALAFPVEALCDQLLEAQASVSVAPLFFDRSDRDPVET